MFSLANVQPFFWAPVTVDLVGDNGARIKGTFQAKYKRLEQTEYEDLLARVQAAFMPTVLSTGEKATPITDKQVVELVLLDWDDMADERNVKLPFNKKSLARVDRVLGVRSAIVTGFFDAHAKAPEKNSEAPPATSTTE